MTVRTEYRVVKGGETLRIKDRARLAEALAELNAQHISGPRWRGEERTVSDWTEVTQPAQLRLVESA